MKVRWLTSDGRADRRLKRTRLTLGCPSRQLWRTAEMGGFLPVPICPTGHAYVLLAALGQRRDGRQLIGLDRPSKSGWKTRATRARGPRLLRAASRWSSAIAAAARPRVTRPAACQLDGFL